MRASACIGAPANKMQGVKLAHGETVRLFVLQPNQFWGIGVEKIHGECLVWVPGVAILLSTAQLMKKLSGALGLL